MPKSMPPSLVVTMSYLPPPVGKYFLQAHATHTPCLLLAPCASKQNVFVFSIDAYGALVILYHAGTAPRRWRYRSQSNPDRPRGLRVFLTSTLHTPSPTFVFLRASCQPFPLDEIISVRAYPSSLTSSISSFVQTGLHTLLGHTFVNAACPASGLTSLLRELQVIPFTQPSGPRRRPRGVMLFLCA